MHLGSEVAGSWVHTVLEVHDEEQIFKSLRFVASCELSFRISDAMRDFAPGAAPDNSACRSRTSCVKLWTSLANGWHRGGTGWASAAIQKQISSRTSMSQPSRRIDPGFFTSIPCWIGCQSTGILGRQSHCNHRRWIQDCP